MKLPVSSDSWERFCSKAFTNIANSHILDTAAGQSDLMEPFRVLNAHTYGMEDSWDHGEYAKKNVQRFIRGAPFFKTRVSNNAFGLVICRIPPAENRGNAQQMSLISDTGSARAGYIHYATKKLAHGGIGCFVLDHKTLEIPVVANLLMQYFDIAAVYVFRFSDVRLVIGTLRPRRDMNVKSDDLPHPKFFSVSSHDHVLGLRIPHTPGPTLFSSTVLDPGDILQLAKNSPLWQSVQNDIHRRAHAQNEMPPMPLRQGHVALQLATGRLDGVIGQGEHRHVIKGQVLRIRGEPMTTILEDGQSETIVPETLAVEITALDQNGQIHRFVSADDEEKEGG